MVVLNHISYAGSRILISLYALHFSSGPFVIGILVALYAIVPLCFAVYSGRLSDRIGHRIPMLAGSIGLAIGLAIPFVMPGMTALYVSAAIVGGTFSFFNVAAQALVGAISPKARRSQNFAILSMAYAIATLAGPLIVGYSVEYFSHQNTYLVLALIVVPTVLLLAVSGKRYAAAAKGPEIEGPRRVVDLVRNRPLLWMFIASGTCVTGWDLFNFYMPIYGTAIGLSPSSIGIIVSTFGVATLVVRLFMAKLTRRWSEENVLCGALIVGAVAFLLVPLFKTVPTLMLVAFVCGIGLGCGQPLTMTLTYARSPKGRAGEANGLRQMSNNVTHLVVPVIFGAVGSAFGIAPVFMTNAIFLSAGAYVARKK
jgi:MFS family permease